MELEEDVVGLRVRPGVAQIVDDRLPDIVEHRQHQDPSGLVLDDLDDVALPLQVTEPQPGDVTSAQPESCRQQDQRQVSLASRASPVDGADQALDLAPRIGRGHSRPPRVVDPWHERTQILCEHALIVQKAQDAAQRAHGVVDRRQLIHRQTLDEAMHMLRRQIADVVQTGVVQEPRKPLQVQARVPNVGRRQPLRAHRAHISPERGSGGTDELELAPRPAMRHHTGPLEVAEQVDRSHPPMRSGLTDRVGPDAQNILQELHPVLDREVVHGDLARMLHQLGPHDTELSDDRRLVVQPLHLNGDRINQIGDRLDPDFHSSLLPAGRDTRARATTSGWTVMPRTCHDNHRHHAHQEAELDITPGYS
jgi:hypothetical protein